MKYVILGVALSLCLSGCATPNQLKETKALGEVHKTERKVMLDKLEVATTSHLLEKQKEKLSTDQATLQSNRATFEELYNGTGPE